MRHTKVEIDRALRMLGEVAEGINFQGVADRHNISKQRVAQILSKLYWYLGANNLCHAIYIATKRRLID